MKPKDETPEAEKQRKHADAEKRRDHLADRDGWDLKGVAPECLHLMVRCMEAWIATDPDGLTSYYGNDFHAKSLPARANLEDEPKDELYKKLAQATKDTLKGEYLKIKHAA